MSTRKYQADVIIAGAGISGLVTALELLDQGHSVVMFDRNVPAELGGLARWSFGGMFFVNSPVQRRVGIKDSVDQALKDWYHFAEFDPEDHWPRAWAEKYVHQCTDEVYRWLRARGVSYFPVVHWVERGKHIPGNSVPRFHMVWGTGHGLVEAMKAQLERHPHRDRLQIHFRHKVEEILQEGGQIIGLRGMDEETNTPFEARGTATVIASGGISGSIERVKQNWYKPWGQAPEVILNGSHRYSDGLLHDRAAGLGANITHLDRQWNYAAGVHHPDPGYAPPGLSLVPPKSALWLNWRGERIGPEPLITAYDTRWLVEAICQQERKYSWQVLNRKIMLKEFAISGAEHNEAIREKNIWKFLLTILRGNKKLVNDMLDNCIDFVTARSVDELAEKMNALNGDNAVDREALKQSIQSYDVNIRRGPKYHNDSQLRRIAHARQYRGDRVRTCKFQPIDDPKAYPLVAIRLFIVSRKSLGGIQTDLDGRVLTIPDPSGQQSEIPGLYAVGEASGFGGGGSHGLRSLEGTFLGTCVLTGRSAARHIKKNLS